jgi:hypothetical protein
MKVPVLGFLRPEVRMEHIGPGNHHQNNESFRLELHQRVIKNFDGRERRLSRLRDEFDF